MRRSLALLVPLGLAAGGLVAALSVRTGTAAPGDQRIAVVDMLAVLSDSPQKKGIDERQMGKRKELDDAAAAADKDLKAKRQELLNLPRGEASRQKEEEFFRAKALAEADDKIREGRAVSEYTDQLEGLYRDVEYVVQQVAREQGFSIVLNKSKEAFNLRTPGADEFFLRVGARTVVWADPAVDITQAVSARMAASAPKAPPVPATPQPGGGTPPTPPPPPPVSGPGPTPGSVPPSGPGMR